MTGQPSRTRGQFFRNGDGAMSGSSPIDLIIDRLTRHGCEPRAAGSGQWKSRCPAHQGKSLNLSIKENADGSVLLHCHHASNGSETCSAVAIVDALGLELGDLFPSAASKVPTRSKATSAKPQKKSPGFDSLDRAVNWMAGTLFADEKGRWKYNDSFWIVRFDLRDGSGKEYKPVRRDPDGWRLKDPPGKLPLYHFGELKGADVVFLLEGEKSADLVRGLGFVATTSSHGAKSAARTDWTPLAGKTVIVLPDKNSAGEIYLDVAGKNLAKLDPAPDVRVVRLDVKEDEDVEQWLDELPEQWDLQQRRKALEEAGDRGAGLVAGGGD